MKMDLDRAVGGVTRLRLWRRLCMLAIFVAASVLLQKKDSSVHDAASGYCSSATAARCVAARAEAAAV
ncbi:Hypothetical predicted protein [Olea europaea subsp. europaea]|uniref:Uncharacterized protein n=1 Tax=Olea europaea subsp. europaea TaxID=158383 RepID=A0A8S0RUC7_OLEEU|nr:Hypothetical predicted protein [Olea europaea subsp. europaea]